MKEDIQPPETGQESVWDYPTPPRWEDCLKHIQVVFNGVVVADSRQSVRMLETGHPPVYYIPQEDVVMECLEVTDHTTPCEYKGLAHYFSLVVGEKRAGNAAWHYPEPESPFDRVKGYVAFYAGLMDACMVDGELVKPQSGGFYGGWITSDIAGPFKGELDEPGEPDGQAES